MADGTLEQEAELRQFLKLVRPEWCKARRNGRSDIQRVMDKLRSVGVVDKWEFMQRVAKNRINEDLAGAGHTCFSRDTLECVMKQTAFFRALESLNEANFRQTGLFAHVPQMLSRGNLRTKAAAEAATAAVMEGDISSPVGSVIGASAHDEDMSPYASTSEALEAMLNSPAQSCETGVTRYLGGPAASSACRSWSVRSALRVVDPDEDVRPHPRLRGFRGDIRGTAGRGLSESVSLPSLAGAGGRVADTRLRPPGAGSTDLARRSGSPRAGDGSLLAAAAHARAALDRNFSRLGSDFDTMSSPKALTFVQGDLGGELAELHMVATRPFTSPCGSGANGGPGVAEEALEKLARAGEEDLSSLDHSISFAEQRGTDAQVLHIAAFYAKMGLDTFRVARALRKSTLPLGELCMKWDELAMVHIQDAASSMASRPRPSHWTGFHGVPPASVVKSIGVAKASASAGPAGRVRSAPAAGGCERAPPPQRGVLRYAEAMLKEQVDLGEKARLHRIMQGEGPGSPMRKHVTANIRQRLKAERDVETEKMEVQQSCNNIRRQLTLMGNAKRDLNNLRRTILDAERYGHPGQPSLFSGNGLGGVLRGPSGDGEAVAQVGGLAAFAGAL